MLSFSSRSKSGTVNYWNPASDELDLAGEGRRRADELGQLIQAEPDRAILLPFVARAIGEGGGFGPMETAFFHRIGEHAA